MLSDARPANADLAAIRERVEGASPFLEPSAAYDEIPGLIARIEELRAALEPLLDGGWAYQCPFCHATKGLRLEHRTKRVVEHGTEHTEDCPTLKADELLGRL